MLALDGSVRTIKSVVPFRLNTLVQSLALRHRLVLMPLSVTKYTLEPSVVTATSLAFVIAVSMRLMSLKVAPLSPDLAKALSTPDVPAPIILPSQAVNTLLSPPGLLVAVEGLTVGIADEGLVER